MSDRTDFVENRAVMLATSTIKSTGRVLQTAIRKMSEAVIIIKHLIRRLTVPP